MQIPRDKTSCARSLDGRDGFAIFRFKAASTGTVFLHNTRPNEGSHGEIQKLIGAVAAGAIAFGASPAVPASAADNIKPFGQQERLNDWGTGAPMIGYTVRDLSPSSDPVPHNGQLYAATVTVDAFGSGVTPMVSMLNARAEHGANYPLIADAGVGGALAPGGSSTGKLYFDVVGDTPNSVVYNDGIRDILAWIPGPPVGGTRP